jgi:hypothetical protein
LKGNFYRPRGSVAIVVALTFVVGGFVILGVSKSSTKCDEGIDVLDTAKHVALEAVPPEYAEDLRLHDDQEITKRMPGLDSFRESFLFDANGIGVAVGCSSACQCDIAMVFVNTKQSN